MSSPLHHHHDENNSNNKNYNYLQSEGDSLLLRSQSDNALRLSAQYGSTPKNRLLVLAPPILKQQQRETDENDEGQEGDVIDEDFLFNAKEELLGRTASFDLPNSPDRGFRATAFNLVRITRPYMRAMHASWLCFFASYSVQFAMAPLLPQLKISLNLSKQDIWLSNVWMAVGGIPMRFILGSLSDSYGSRTVITSMLLVCSVSCALSGVIVVNLPTLLVVRFVIGSMDAFVPSQCWITTMFVREVAGTIMAIVAGLGSCGSAVSQLVVGYLFDGWSEWTGGDDDLAWKLTLLFPPTFAIMVAHWAYFYTDDCPLGNFVDVKKAGLMMQRSAVDSFRSGVVNLNSWILFVQYGFSSGCDTTLSNGIAIYYHVMFHQKISTIGAIAFLYGFPALFARGLGGFVSDKIGERFSLSGRLWIHFFCMMSQGAMNIWFARTETFYPSLLIMFGFAVTIQLTTGTCYGIVPFIDSANTGSVAGIVGAGGNVGAVLLGLIFMYFDYGVALEYMAYFTIGSALLTPFIAIKGYKGIVFGKDDHDDPSRKQHSPLIVPKIKHSPHFVKLHHKARSRN